LEGFRFQVPAGEAEGLDFHAEADEAVEFGHGFVVRQDFGASGVLPPAVWHVIVLELFACSGWQGVPAGYRLSGRFMTIWSDVMAATS
jgi:hypothetical protein